MLWSFLTSAAVLLMFMVSCEGKGYVIVTIRTYSNSDNKRHNDNCCDRRNIRLRCVTCDTYFKLYVNDQSSAYSTHTGRIEGIWRNTALPIRKEFAFSQFSGNVVLKLEVWDDDLITGDDFIDRFSKNIELDTVRSGPPSSRDDSERVVLTSKRVRIELDLDIYCDTHFYSPSCSVKCVPRDDSSGHYTCDSQGRKVCRRGWYGEDCTRYCVPRDDSINGHYFCDKQGNKRCLRNWQGPSCKSCVKNWYGKRCLTYCVPQDSDEHGHYKCKLEDGKKECLPWWFSTECDVYCVPHNDDDNGHYDCAHDGSKTCKPGWFSENCVKFCVPHDDDDNGHYDCTVHGNKTCKIGWYGEQCLRFCAPQNDDERGHYTCDSNGNKECLDGYRPPECKECLLGRYGSNCSLSCTNATQQGYFDCADDGSMLCKPWWYGLECLQYCVPHDDSKHGHYTCNPLDGGKVCKKGWKGPDCLDRI